MNLTYGNEGKTYIYSYKCIEHGIQPMYNEFMWFWLTKEQEDPDG